MQNASNPYLRSPEEGIYVPMPGPPQVPIPSPEIYAAMGQENIFRMCEDFYRLLGASEIRPMFSHDMPKASEKLAAFFVFRLGGPPLYQQKHGQPRLRERHFPFKITEEARQVWLATFRKTLENADKKYGFPMQHMQGFWNFLEGFSGWMVNAR